MLYLLQLVQALKFDAPTSTTSRRRQTVHSSHTSSRHEASHSQSLEDFLVGRSVRNPILGNHFYWYLMCELEDAISSKMFKKVAFHFMTKLEQVRLSRGHHPKCRLTLGSRLQTGESDATRFGGKLNLSQVCQSWPKTCEAAKTRDPRRLTRCARSFKIPSMA